MLQKALLSVTARERAQLCGDFDCREVGHYTESADFRSSTRRYAKTLRFCHIWPSVASVHYGAGERYETRGIP